MTDTTVAQTILAQIMNLTEWAVPASWGMKDTAAIGEEENSLGALSFKVNGRIHKGSVKVCLQYNDLYAIKLYDQRYNKKHNLPATTPKIIVKDLDVESMVSNLDAMIEGSY